MMLRASVMVLCLVALPCPSRASDEADFARHLPGCWQYGNLPPSGELPAEPQVIFLSRMCFEGGVEGTVTYGTCDGFGTFDCWDGTGSYSLRGGKLHFHSEHQRDRHSCDGQVLPGEELRLYNCQGVDSPYRERSYVRAE